MMNNAVIVFIFFGLLVVSTINVSFSDGSTWAESERQALRRFKQDLKDPSNRLASWVGDGDCCTWTGVVCHNLTGHVVELHLNNPFFMPEYPTFSEQEAYKRSKLAGKINPSVLELKSLSYLDLSLNDFEGIQIPIFLGSMINLRYLNLSGAGLAGMIPHQLGNLSNLQYLDLSLSSASKIYVENFGWLSGLSMLEHLDLSGVDLSMASDWLLVTNTLPSLAVLQLSNCQLHHFPPSPVAKFSSLAYLDLSGNQFDNRLIPSWILSLSHLIFLDLGSNNFEGPIPDGLQNLTSLRYLDLSSNAFNSSIPDWLYSFNHLEYLSLKSNSFKGKFPDSFGNLTSISTLDLSYNTLGGKIPRSLGKLCNLRSISLSGFSLNQEISEIFYIFSECISGRLEYMDLENSQIFGHLTSQLVPFKNLNTLRSSSNFISGPIPISLGELSSLKFLDLSYNNLNGILSQSHFANLTRLLVFYVSENSLTMKVNPDWIPPFQLRVLGLRSCHIGPQFPFWLQSQKFLLHFDISNSGVIDAIPVYLFKSPQYVHVNLSHNQIYGEVPNLTEVTQLKSLHMNSNNLSGSLPLISSSMYQLDLSNNAFSGSISHFLCSGLLNESSEMQILKLGGNLLSGNLPDCLMKWQNLLLLHLQENKFSGGMPTSLGVLASLRSLYLRKNGLYGTIPMSLQNCTELIVLDVGENELSGSVPTWIGERLSKLMILDLRSNKFDGLLPAELCHLVYLQILDLANNNISGDIPGCINNLSAMVTIGSSSGNKLEYLNQPHTSHLNFSMQIFLEDALLVVKGKAVEYSTILDLVRSIDLSQNSFSGEIPMEVTNLGALQSLNLSYNSFTGKIPESIGNMRSLESIDLSVNQLFGEIPQSISYLSFLSYLNLSSNKLIGEIPRSTQLQTLDASSFIGNELCGSPLPKSCAEIFPTPEYGSRGEKDDNEHEVKWFYVSMALGFVVGFGSFIGPLLVIRKWRYMYNSFLDNLVHKCGSAVRKYC